MSRLEVNGFKLAAYVILSLVFYFMLFFVVGINLRQQGMSMQTVDTWFYVGFLLIVIGCVLASVEKK